MQGRKRMGEENMRTLDCPLGGRTERMSKERGILTEGAIIGLVRNLALQKFSGILKNEPS